MTKRNVTWRRRARRLHKVNVDGITDAELDDIAAQTGRTRAAVVRELVAEERQRIEMQQKRSAPANPWERPAFWERNNKGRR